MDDVTEPTPEPPRFETGDWAFDPEQDPARDDPKICRFRLRKAEYAQVADAIVRGQSLEIDGHEVVGMAKDAEFPFRGFLAVRFCMLDLRRLYDAVAAHPEARLAQAEEDAEGYLRPAGVFDQRGTEVGGEPTEIGLHGCVVESCDCSDLDIACTLRPAARFAADAWFGGARFAADAWFGGARFAAAAWFGGARFAAAAWFGGARFAAAARFGGARFAADARFGGARFAGDAEFGGARFAAVAWFGEARIASTGRLLLTDARFARSVSLYEAKVRGGLFFTGSTLDERLTFDGTNFAPNARLGFNRFLARGGATIELRREHLHDPGRAARIANSRVGLGGRRRRPAWWRAWEFLRPVRLWLGQCRPPAMMEGDDARDPVAMKRAADDYDLLASNYRNQPATDWEEDWCRWRAHELRRLAAWTDFREEARAFLGAGAKECRLGPGVPIQCRWVYEYVRLMGEIVVFWIRFILVGLWHVVARWLIQRTMVGYLLQTHRIMVAGAMLIVVCALIYALSASDATIVANAGSEAYRPWEGGLLERLRFGLYFSLTTFVTLGYGDYAPTGWWKLVTGIEALAGVTLLALFTVAWGRKMVR